MAADNPLAPLEFLIGAWDTIITMADGAAADPTHATDTYAWSANGKFIEHRVDADLGNGQRVQSLEVISAASEGHGFASFSFDPNGTVSAFALALAGHEWTVDGLEQRFSGRFSADFTRLDGQWEQHLNTSGWEPLMSITLHKRKA
ncbi:MAG: hypothetical protein ABIT10_00635 [Alteraurantiacibacter sp.]